MLSIDKGGLIVVIGAGRPASETYAAEVFIAEVQKRSQVTIQVIDETEHPKPQHQGKVVLVIGTEKDNELIAKWRSTVAKGAVLPVDGYTIDTRPDAERRIYIAGQSTSGLFAGVGRLLRLMRFSDDALLLPRVTESDYPRLPTRGMYLATHFHNYYEEASEKEIAALLADLALWGTNDLLFNYPIQQYDDTNEKKSLETFERLRRVAAMGKRLGMRTSLVQGPSQNTKNTPPEAKAKEIPGVWKFGPELCPSTSEGLALMRRNAKNILNHFEQIDTLITWPYDGGGCGCSNCMPWGGNGFLRGSEAWAEAFRNRFPSGKVILSTWWFDRPAVAALRGDFKGLFRYMETESPSWFQGLLTGELNNNMQASLLNRPSPSRYPLSSFPEIAMKGMHPWGGSGANPLPKFNELYGTQLKGLIEGGWPYSEGIYDDVNKYYWIRYYWNPGLRTDDILADYASYYLAPEVAADAVRLFHLLEKTVSRNGWNFHRLDEANAAWELACGINARLPAWSKNSWRWRILFIRAGIDQTMKESGIVSPEARKTLKAYLSELRAIYHVTNATARALIPPELPPDGAPVNIALGADVTVSSTHPDRPNKAHQLTDGKIGENYGDNFWIGDPSKETTTCVTIDLNATTAIASIRLHCCMRDKRYVYVPRSIKVEVSMDGKTFQPALLTSTETPEPVSVFQNFPVEGAAVSKEGAREFNLNSMARYVRLILDPSLHEGDKFAKCAGLSEIEILTR